MVAIYNVIFCRRGFYGGLGAIGGGIRKVHEEHYGEERRE